MARTDKKKTNDPHGLVPWVKEVVRLRRENGLAGQPDSPSRRAGWGLILNAVGASCPTSFTIQASWMGSLPDLCVTTWVETHGYRQWSLRDEHTAFDAPSARLTFISPFRYRTGSSCRGRTCGRPGRRDMSRSLLRDWSAEPVSRRSDWARGSSPCPSAR